MNHERIAKAIANLDAWLETMRQPGGYGGPVAHWWQNRFQYTGPGLDWRYEGILIGYATLVEKQPDDPRWHERVNAAARDLIEGQRPDGSYLASRFEINPGTLGTPHEAAASLGLLMAAGVLEEAGAAIETARRNLGALTRRLEDGSGIADRVGGHERVPNKLATLAHALLLYADRTGDRRFDAMVRTCLDDVLRFQVSDGQRAGAVHQYAPDGRTGDGRFFPYYASRCVPPLVEGARAFGEPRYRAAAEAIVSFLERAMRTDGSWPQVLYTRGAPALTPRWSAGVADVLTAFVAVDRGLPVAAFERLLSSQHPAGGFPTAEGFAAVGTRNAGDHPRDLRDVLPVVGWNDKVLRLLAEQLAPATNVPAFDVGPGNASVTVAGRPGRFLEDGVAIRVLVRGSDVYDWRKGEPWARTVGPAVNVR